MTVGNNGMDAVDCLAFYPFVVVRIAPRLLPRWLLSPCASRRRSNHSGRALFSTSLFALRALAGMIHLRRLVGRFAGRCQLWALNRFGSACA